VGVENGLMKHALPHGVNSPAPFAQLSQHQTSIKHLFLRPNISSTLTDCTRDMPEQPTMSPGTKELLKKVRMIVPPMLEKFHKGKGYNHILLELRLTAKQVSWVG